MKLVVGLGNPGKRYAKTRHNAGFIAVDAARSAVPNASAWEVSKKFNAEIAGAASGSEKIIFAKPLTFMNESGIAVQLIAHYYKIPPADIIVMHDEKDIPLGEIKVQTNRGHAGHNGVRSIIEHIGTENFTRIRIGVGSSNEKAMRDVSKFVLGKFGFRERGTAKAAIGQSVLEIKKLLNLS